MAPAGGGLREKQSVGRPPPKVARCRTTPDASDRPPSAPALDSVDPRPFQQRTQPDVGPIAPLAGRPVSGSRQAQAHRPEIAGPHPCPRRHHSDRVSRNGPGRARVRRSGKGLAFRRARGLLDRGPLGSHTIPIETERRQELLDRLQCAIPFRASDSIIHEHAPPRLEALPQELESG